MDNTSPRTRILAAVGCVSAIRVHPGAALQGLKGWHLSKKLSTFLKNSPKYLLMKELDSYCGIIDNTIYAYVKNYHTCSGIFS